MLVNDECSSGYNTVGNFCCQFGIGERKLCMTMDQHVRPVRPTALQSVRPIALSAIAVEFE